MTFDGHAAVGAADALTAAVDALIDAPLHTLTHPQLLAVLERVDTALARVPAATAPMLARLAAEASPTELGARNLREVLRHRLRISTAEASRRLADAADLAPRTGVSGAPMDPVRAVTAAARAAGTIDGEHVRIIRATMARLPEWVDVVTREQAERDLVRAARSLDPDGLRRIADRLLALLDQDGPEPDDTERARRRGLVLGRQGHDGMTKLTGYLSPEARATWEPILAKLAAPGMANADDSQPRVSGTPSQAQIDGDQRTAAQRHHDAFLAVGRAMLASGELGRHNGLPVTAVVSMSLRELESAVGCAVTGGGAVMSIPEAIRLAGRGAHHYLRIFDDHTGQDLYLGRAKRLASPAQRISLYARDRGCTMPGCTVAAYFTQVHHTQGWVRCDGHTNIDELTLACPADNRLAEDGWTVTIVGGLPQLTPPPDLDRGGSRVNTYHHPDRILRPPDENAGGAEEVTRANDSDPPDRRCWPTTYSMGEATPDDPWAGYQPDISTRTEAPDDPWAQSDGPRSAAEDGP